MGNRGIIKPEDSDVGIYLHWNGGRDSVEAFLKYCELKEYRGFGEDTEYARARLCQVIANFIGGKLSVGVGTYNKSHGDNGVYIVRGWNIVDRIDCQHEQYNHDLQDMLQAIDQAQPEPEQIPEKLEETADEG